jgi:hypothetical protein
LFVDALLMLHTYSERAFEHDVSETWTLRRRLWEEHELKVFQNMTLRKIFGFKMVEITLDCKKLLKEEFQYLYCSPNAISMIKSGMMDESYHFHEE